MIRVTIELISAITGATSEIGRMFIANNGDGSITSGGKLGDYTVAVCRRGTGAVPKPISRHGPTPSRGGSVRDYPRLAYNVWRLITRACLVAFPEEAVPRKSKDAPALDAGVMRGLQLINHYTPREMGAFPSSVCPEEHNDIRDARAWLAAANSEDA